jgi:myo-inositol catabolism protein IolC
VLGVLVDEQYAAAAVPRVRAAGLRVVMPVEAGGTPELALAFGEDFERHLERLPPDLAKLLVRWSPGDDAGRKRRQGELLGRVQATLEKLAIPLMLELMVPQAATAEASARAALTAAAIDELRELGIAPAVWKLEPQADADAYALLAGRSGGAPCVVLGAGGALEHVAAQVRTVARTPGWAGFAVGRSVWAPALDAWDAGAERADCVARVADGYVQLIDAHLAAAA